MELHAFIFAAILRCKQFSDIDENFIELILTLIINYIILPMISGAHDKISENHFLFVINSVRISGGG